MQGDALASGARSATFLPPSIGNPKEGAGSGFASVATEKPAEKFPCKCGFVAKSAAEFSDHVHEVHIY